MEKVIINKQSCGNKNYYELRVAFGDMQNCQLKCPFCFTMGQKACIYELSELQKQDYSNVKIIRFTGGEPLLNQNQVDSIIDELRKLQKNIDIRPLIVIQTNGLNINNIDVNGFFELKYPILFEISLKGTNAFEYRYLTFDKAINMTSAQELFNKQVEAYHNICNLFMHNDNIAILARLGIFHSSLTSPSFKFVFPNTNDLMFNPSNWDNAIINIVEDQRVKWKDSFKGKFLVEKIKTPGNGTPVMGQRYRKIINDLKLKNLLVEAKSSIPRIYNDNYIYLSGYDTYRIIAEQLRI